MHGRRCGGKINTNFADVGKTCVKWVEACWVRSWGWHKVFWNSGFTHQRLKFEYFKVTTTKSYKGCNRSSGT